MIKIGLTGFGDHEELYGKLRADYRLSAYSEHFSIVEIDSSFYAVQPVRNTTKWAEQSPDGFRFIMKAYQGMTGHLREKPNYYSTSAEMYRAFHESIAPLRASGKLAMALFQFPPWFDCTRDNVGFLREAKTRMLDVPSSLEFRHESWYSPGLRERTLDFLKSEGWIHTVADEPQAGSGSIPVVPVATSDELTYVRLHGRNIQGWQQGSHPEWRRLRYLYRYSLEELTEWRDILLGLQQSSRDIYVVFNNNSGGDATDNAKELERLMGLDGGLAPRQLSLF